MEITIADLGINYSPRTEHVPYGLYPQESAAFPEAKAARSIFGTTLVYELDGLWFYYQHQDGGSTRSRGMETKDAVETELLRTAQNRWNHWERRVQEVAKGDKRIIICEGVFRSLGREDGGPNSMRGHGGHEFAFRMLATGKVVTSTNVWFGGRIPAEFVERLPDNAERIESPAERRTAESHAAFLKTMASFEN
jgi:hypothetical protein